MTGIVFGDRSAPPGEDELAAALGRSAGRWDELLAHLRAAYPPVTGTWRYYRASGWILRVMRRKRTIFWLVPCRRHFRASTAFGEKAVRAARESDLPPAVVESILVARKYAEGRPVRVEARTRADVEVLRRIAAIKMTS